MPLVDVIVTDIVQETPTVKTLYLSNADGTSMGAYSPGAHIDVVGPTSITRQYSLCSRPDGTETYAVAVKREDNSRGGSVALHELKVGDTLRISEPRNLLGIAVDATKHVLVAAGIGITPMLSMARHMHVNDIDFELHYFSRSEQEAAFLPLLRDRCPERLHAHVGVARDDQAALIGAALAGAATGTHLYVCGPDGFMIKVAELAGQHLPPESVHIENFHATEQPVAGSNTAFEVELDGETFHVPADRSIAQVLIDGGGDVDTSCQEGICGTCIMTVLAGDPEHRDSVLSTSERESGEVMAVCVSRTRGERLVLDYY
ncbi:PDR/VanB family oxidoreductase [Williamsia phyllosphaerae]|uniref:Vanillate O-demethylase n=1 Tax=Williamsia phyllosphaerae TaxID=885042 RepID=A0ABQ1U788_9NOCA|nr:PDR/VanB family oxidoreductase [Williamsia phyllosphaerae]GGF11459.1 vanillate O-demethylase [Williamsia phyllosphaerae]